MKTPFEIDFQGMEANSMMRDAIRDHVAGLEDRFGRITAGRVVVRGPTDHHQSGGSYEVHIRLALPNGREVNVARTPSNDERYADPSYAINDAFKRARRLLQDHVRKLQGRVKTHVPEPSGTVIEINADGGFGFLQTSDGREIYFHRNSVLKDAFSSLKIGARVTFAEEQGEKGPQASTVRVGGKQGSL
jgi:cold shock CspA family protein